MVKPYTETRINSYKFIRTFSVDAESEELVWHRDHQDRTVRVLQGVGWKLQMDDELPVLLSPECTYYIPRKEYHRVIKGATDLVVEITESY